MLALRNMLRTEMLANMPPAKPVSASPVTVTHHHNYPTKTLTSKIFSYICCVLLYNARKFKNTVAFPHTRVISGAGDFFSLQQKG